MIISQYHVIFYKICNIKDNNIRIGLDWIVKIFELRINQKKNDRKRIIVFKYI